MDAKLIDALERCFDLPPEQAVEYMQSQGFKVTHDWRQALDAIREHCFTVSKVAAADTLQSIHDELTKSMKNGMSYNDFKSNMPKILQSKGVALKDDGSAFRYELMYRMNMQSAYQNGQFFEMEAANDDFPYREFVSIEDTRTSSTCRQLNGVVVHHTDSVYLTNQTPRHFNCRSTWMSLTEEQAKKKGINKKDLSKLKPTEGFGLNPKDAKYKPNMAKYEKGIKEQVEKAVKEEAPEVVPEKVDKEIRNLNRQPYRLYKFMPKDERNKLQIERDKYEANLEHKTKESLEKYKNFDYAYLNYYKRNSKKIQENNGAIPIDYYKSLNAIVVKGKWSSPKKMGNDLKSTIDEMEKDFSYKLPDNTTLYRGEFYTKMPDNVAKILNGKVDEINTNGFFSTSYDESTANAFAKTGGRQDGISVIYNIFAKKGAQVGIGTKMEMEVIFKHNQNFKVVSAWRNGNDVVIDIAIIN